MFLGCQLAEKADTWIRDGGGLMFPAIPSLPFDSYRGTLYDAEELYAGLERGYDATPDARIYAWSRQHDEKGDTSRTLAAALHDHAIADALDDLPDGKPWIGVMGGHGVAPWRRQLPSRRPPRPRPGPPDIVPSSPAAAPAPWKPPT